MEKIIVKRKEFEIVSQISEHSYKVSYKGKYYWLRRFTDNPEAYDEFVYGATRLFNAGVPSPKIFRLDNKSLDVVMTYLGEETVFDMLCKGPLEECVYEALYKSNYMAKVNKMLLRFQPDKWMYVDGRCYYIAYVYDELNEKNKNYLVDKGIRYWYYTKEFKELVKEKGRSVDESYFKSDFNTNKEILLTACKYFK